MANAILAIPTYKKNALASIIARLTSDLRWHDVKLQVVPFIATQEPEAGELARRPVNDTDSFFIRPKLKDFKVPRLLEMIERGVTLFDLSRPAGGDWHPKRIWLRILDGYLLIVNEYLEEQWPNRPEPPDEPVSEVALTPAEAADEEDDQETLLFTDYVTRQRLPRVKIYTTGTIPLAEFLEHCKVHRNNSIARAIVYFARRRYDSKVTWPEVVAHMAWDPNDPDQQPNPVAEPERPKR